MSTYIKCRVVDDLAGSGTIKDLPEELLLTQLPRVGEHLMHNAKLYVIKGLAHWPVYRDAQGNIGDQAGRPTLSLHLAKVTGHEA
jgi:hypothetical protein